jgi:hypothetical protein
MKFLGKEIKDVDKGYFGVRRCTICDEQLRDVNLVEIYSTNHVCFVPLRKTLVSRILVCQHCHSYMEINNDLWRYYSSYYNKRFSKTTTDNIVNILTDISKQIEQNGIKLNTQDDASLQSLDLIYKSLSEKYKVCENVEEIISVFYKP